MTIETMEKRLKANENLRQRNDARYPIVPTAEPDEYMRWRKEDEGKGLWMQGVGAAYTMIDDERARSDPLMRTHLRCGAMEVGEKSVRTRDGVKVNMDRQERALLTGANTQKSTEANRKVLQVSVPLHVCHDFTDVWAVDGSKDRKRDADGRLRKRVAAGAYEGVLTLEREVWSGETEEEYERRCVGAGMIGARLPATMDVVDAELYAILMAVREVSERDGAEHRRCLVMSDSLSAMRMIEDAWRGGVRVSGAGRDREAILEAINTYRRRIGLLVTMYVPAHSGVSPNAMADAVAKAYLQARLDEHEVSKVIEDGMASGRWVRRVTAGGGEPEMMWDATAFNTTREAIGWWVRDRETRRLRGGKRSVDVERLGRPWAARGETRWGAVWEATGARLDAGRRRRQGGGKEEDEDDVGEGKVAGGDEWGTEAERGAWDRERCGVAMAARAGALWETGRADRGVDEVCGCAACCSRARGWQWQWQGDVDRAWRCTHDPARAVQQASMAHVLLRCPALEGAHATRGEMRDVVRRIRAAVMRRQRGKKGWIIGEGRVAVVAMLNKAEGAIQGQVDAMRETAFMDLLAGRLPPPKPSGREAQWRAVERVVIEGVRELQSLATRVRKAWGDKAEPEMARRAERDGGQVGKRWRQAALAAWRSAAAAQEGWDGTREEAERRQKEAAGQKKQDRKQGQRGWTVTRALIWRMRAEGRVTKRERGAKGTSGDGQAVCAPEPNDDGGNHQAAPSTAVRGGTGAGKRKHAAAAPEQPERRQQQQRVVAGAAGSSSAPPTIATAPPTIAETRREPAEENAEKGNYEECCEQCERNEEGCSDDGMTGLRRPKRAGITLRDYSQVRRRNVQKRKVSSAYMEPSKSGKTTAGKATLSKQIEVGATTVERIVGDRYEWRDREYVKKRRIVYDDGG